MRSLCAEDLPSGWDNPSSVVATNKDGATPIADCVVYDEQGNSYSSDRRVIQGHRYR